MMVMGSIHGPLIQLGPLVKSATRNYLHVSGCSCF